MDEAKVVSWIKEAGDYIEEDEVVLEVETDKATLEVESPGVGYLVQQNVDVGDTVEVGVVLGLLSSENKPILSEEKVSDSEPVAEEKVEENTGSHHVPIQNNRNPFLEGERIRVSPAARKLAKQQDIDYSQLTGTGPKGRIILTDIHKAIENQEQTVVEADKSNELQKSMPSKEQVHQTKEDKVVPLSTMRRVIATRMQDSFKNVPQFTLTKEVDCSTINETRKTLNNINDSDVNLSFNDFMIQTIAK